MKYVANDGTVFDNKIDCQGYEKAQADIEQDRVDKIKQQLLDFLETNNVEIGGDDVYLYSLDNSDIQSDLYDD